VTNGVGELRAKVVNWLVVQVPDTGTDNSEPPVGCLGRQGRRKVQWRCVSVPILPQFVDRCPALHTLHAAAPRTMNAAEATSRAVAEAWAMPGLAAVVNAPTSAEQAE
jgi:hypothetical protein